jgi:hypothetical protein
MTGHGNVVVTMILGYSLRAQDTFREDTKSPQYRGLPSPSYLLCVERDNPNGV